MNDEDRAYLLRLENLRSVRSMQNKGWMRVFPGIDLRGMPLRGLDLVRAVLTEADLSHADLSGAHLDGADLIDADLGKAKLKKVHYDYATMWPDGFSPPLR